MKRGVKLNASIRDVFNYILKQAKNVDSNIEGIAAASWQQTEGIQKLMNAFSLFNEKKPVHILNFRGNWKICSWSLHSSSRYD